ncbi:MAG: hypothetical protein JXR73_19840, partial [Candidatus Omnitrophica bacterium]|nr:hypothetical protein [Candidatus Omnitrophota bacterium]
MNKRSITLKETQTKRPKESGVALLTVLALLSIFAIVMVGFTYTIRMEENTIQQYADSVNVQVATEAAIQGVLAQLSNDLNPLKPNQVIGRSQPHYTSLQDDWATGYAGWIGNNLAYDARSHQLDARPQSVFNRKNLRYWPTPIPLGVDEDPPGDVTGIQGNKRFGAGDNAPGLKNIDDSLDGIVDGSVANDDDEDFRVDEDGYDLRRDGKYFAPGTGYDVDNDRLGVFDESAKININFAGNNWGAGNGQTYNLGVSPTELDLPVFLYNRVVRYNTSSGGVTNFNAADAENVARAIVNFRYGSIEDGGATESVRPGEDGRDDDNNGNPKIVQIEEYSNAFGVQNFEGQPFVVMGNGRDDDGDGLQNEEDERYIGPSTQNSSGSPLTEAFDQNNAEQFRPGDKIDNDGNGYIDEQGEGVDDPNEFNVFQPKGNDRPYTTLEDLKLVERMRLSDPALKTFPTLYDILSQSTTIYSQSDEISGPLSAKNNEVAKINPNLSSNWLAVDVWDQNTFIDKADFQYSPKVRLEDLLALQVDKDGDWQADAEINVEDGIDNDGDGLIDEPSDDWDGNHYPSGDFDGFGEADVGAPAFATGLDYDGDGEQRDKIRTSSDEVIRDMRLLGWDDQDGSGSDLTAANFDSRRGDLVTYDERITDIYPGLVVEGDGRDNDGDLLIDDTGDFNGDGLLSYDPEWHVSEDAWGDLNGDGYPGLGGDPEADEDSREGRIVKDPDNRDNLLRTSLADDDYDGYADFYDPQVLAAMFAPELDGVDNDNDGEVDEIGERYIACYDDDEDGRMDEDPPEFQIALNLMDSIDSWMPFPVSEDEDVRNLLGKSQDDPVLADPVTIRTLSLYSTRQRGFRMHPRLLAGPNSSAQDRQEFGEQMRLTLPNPPQTGMPVKFEGVEAIRINEIMAKPVIRLEAEETLDSIQVNQEAAVNDPFRYLISYRSRFSVESGDKDDGQHPGNRHYDTNWGAVVESADGDQAPVSLPSYTFLPNGFQNTLNTYLPIVNMDTMAPAFIFSVTNLAQPAQSDTTLVGTEPAEEAVWVFENIPEGFYDIVLYMHPYHRYRPEVRYFFNGREITFRSDSAFGDVQDNTGPFLSPWTKELIRRDTAILPGTVNESFRLPYRLSPYPMADKYRLSPSQRVVVGSDGELEVRIIANEPIGGPGSGDMYATSFDRLELISPWTQYVELVNLSTEDIDLSGWTIDTPYGHYLIPEDTVIGRMKPSYQGDDGRKLTSNEGLPGDGVPHEPLLKKDKISNAGGTISSTDLLLEDNKVLLANHKNALVEFIKNNYPSVPNIDDRVVEVTLAPQEEAMVIRSLSTKSEPMGSGELVNAQQSDLRLRLVDVQEDILTHNPGDKFVTLSDPSGHYVDSFKYRTTFNNVLVDIPGNTVSMDLAVLPGYRGMESFERTDPTYFDTEISVDNQSGLLSGSRSVPSSIRLDAMDAILLNLDSTKNL